MGISDTIAGFISEMLAEADGSVELRRADIASRFGCVPSQINYVISTRFSPEHGYIVESRRGGGGYIRIRRVRLDPRRLVMHALNSVGDSITWPVAKAFLTNLMDAEVIDGRTAALMAAAMGENTLRCLSPVGGTGRDAVRAEIFKNMLLALLRE
jgi:transcriptional regulator CtsR